MQSEDVLDKATKGVKALLTPKQIIAREQIVKAVLASNQAKFEKSTSISKKSNMNSFLNEYVSRIKENEKKVQAIKTNENQIWSMFVDRHVLKTTKSSKYVKNLCKMHNITL
jgi:hypothetical protein